MTERTGQSIFYVGQEVTCVDAGPREVHFTEELSEGSTYIIAEVIGATPDAPMGGVQLNGLWIGPPYSGFHADRFRPVASTNIDVFERLLVIA